jgi:hypothetical protein
MMHLKGGGLLQVLITDVESEFELDWDPTPAVYLFFPLVVRGTE